MQMSRRLTETRTARQLHAAAEECAAAGFPGIAEVLAEEAGMQEMRERRRARADRERREEREENSTGQR